MLKLGLTAAQIAMKAKKLPLSKLKKMFKEHFGIDNTGLSKDQIATKLASAAQKSVNQSKNVAGAKGALKGGGLTALALGPFIVDKDDKTKPSQADVPSKPKPRPKAKKETPSIPTEKPTPRPKAKQFMKERSGKDSKVEFEATKGNVGMLASKKNLKPVPSGTKGKGLSMLPTKVRNNMGFMYGGGMAKKPRMSNMDYRKANKGLLVISIDMMRKKKKGKKEK